MYEVTNKIFYGIDPLMWIILFCSFLIIMISGVFTMYKEGNKEEETNDETTEPKEQPVYEQPTPPEQTESPAPQEQADSPTDSQPFSITDLL